MLSLLAVSGVVIALVLLGLAVARLRGGTPPGLSGSDHVRRRQADVPNKIELIKAYRRRHGVGLKEAKEAIEAQLRGEHTANAPERERGPAQGAAAADVDALVQAGRLIEAIKMYRDRHDVSLKEAKAAIDALSRSQKR